MRYNILVIDDNKDFSGSIKDDKILLKKHLKKELLTEENNTSEISIQNYKQKKMEVELQAIDDALAQTMGQKAKAAKLLDMTADQMRYRVINAKSEALSLISSFKNIQKYYKL